MSGSDLFTGTLDILILRAVQDQARHGYDLGQMLREISHGVLDVAEGVMYPALHRLEERGLLEAAWGLSRTGRRAKYYSLTASGKQQLAIQYADWTEFTAAVSAVLHGSPDKKFTAAGEDPKVAVRKD